MSKLHLVGFKDWFAPKSTGLIENPSRVLVEKVERDPHVREELIKSLGGKITDVRTALLPVPMEGEPKEAFAKFRRALGDLLRLVDPTQDVFIGFGQGDIALRKPDLESVFRNRFKMRGSPEEFTLKREEPLGWEIGLRERAKNIANRVDGLGVSEDAGSFYCNALGFATFEQFPLNRSLFVHLQGLSNAETAEKIWTANQEMLSAEGIKSAAEMPYGAHEQNLVMLKELVAVWKPFEL